MDERLERLRLCISEVEVLELMKDVKLSPEHDARIGDETIIFPDSHDYDGIVNLPNNDYGLLAKLVTYLSLNGYLGHINYSGGIQAYIGRFRTIWNDLNEIKSISRIAEINDELIEQWIRSQLDKSYGAISIMRKFLRFEDWLRSGSMLPYFLSLNNVMIYDCPSYLELKARHDEESARNRNNDDHSAPKYPLHLLLPILQKAMEYITDYTEDIELMMVKRQHLNDTSTVTHGALGGRAFRFMKKTTHCFQEPSLAALQAYCKTLGKKWKTISTNPGRGPRTIISDAVQQWQAANLIIFGFFSAARSNEIGRQLRNLHTPKTKYHEIDQGYNFTRVIWKTARHGKLHTTPLPPLGMQAYRNLSRHSEQIDGKVDGKLKFPVWVNLGNKMYTDRMRYALMKFSHSVHGEDAPHLTPHQLRHAMASLLSHLNDHNGLMIAGKLLGHESASMTLTYEIQLKTIVLNQINHMANTNEEIAVAFREYEDEESTRLLREVVMPDLNKGKVFVGPAKGIVQFTGSVVNDPESFYAFHSQAIKDGQIVFTQTPTCICVRSTNDRDQMACQRGINIEDYSNVPVQPAMCKGSSCVNSLFSEQNCEMLIQQTQSVKDLAPDDLREMTSVWFFVVGDGLDKTADKIVISEYQEAMKKKAI
jgi:integrase